MFNLFTPKRTPEQELERLLLEIKEMKIDDKEYAPALKNVEILTKAIAQQGQSTVSPDTIVIAVTNILGILLVLNFEKMDIITSKSFGFIMKGRS